MVGGAECNWLPHKRNGALQSKRTSTVVLTFKLHWRGDGLPSPLSDKSCRLLPIPLTFGQLTV